MKAIKRATRLLPVLATALLFAAPFASADETIFNADDYRGKVLVVDFWASWCVPCRRSFPWLDEMQNKYRKQGLVVIGVNMDADPTEADAFLQEFPVNFRIVRDPDGALARKYDVMAMPSSYVIDGSGNIATRHLGFKIASLKEYEAALVAVLENTEAVAATK